MRAVILLGSAFGNNTCDGLKEGRLGRRRSWPVMQSQEDLQLIPWRALGSSKFHSCPELRQWILAACGERLILIEAALFGNG